MSDLAKAAHDLKLVAARFKPFLEVADALERIGSLEEAERLATQRTAAAQHTEAQTKALLDAATTRLLEAEQQVGKARTEAVSVLDEATVKAKDLLDQARKDAKLIGDAATDAKVAILKEIDELKMDRASIQHQLEAKQRELSAITEQITKTKARIAALAG